jgi:hypothetical protein
MTEKALVMPGESGASSTRAADLNLKSFAEHWIARLRGR